MIFKKFIYTYSLMELLLNFLPNFVSKTFVWEVVAEMRTRIKTFNFLFQFFSSSIELLLLLFSDKTCFPCAHLALSETLFKIPFMEHKCYYKLFS